MQKNAKNPGKNVKGQSAIALPIAERNAQAGNTQVPADELRVNLAIGTIVLFICVCLIYLLNYIIYANYAPDIAAIVNKVLPVYLCGPDSCKPEPVERLQFQLSLLLTPFFIFFVYRLLQKGKDFFYKNANLSSIITISGVVLFIFYFFYLFSQNLLYVPNETTAYFFANDLPAKFNAAVILLFYALIIFAFIRYYRQTSVMKIVVNIISYGLVAFLIVDLSLYGLFNLATQDAYKIGETNPVFYSITQVFAGKSLLVDINAQYGLYAWMLNPVFKLIGLSSVKISLVMGLLNSISFFLIYLGLKKIVKNDIIALLAFLCLLFWQYWQVRIPFDGGPRHYYQYCPIRFLFPAISFFLMVYYMAGAPKWRRVILPALAFTAGFGVLWNMDSGLVVFGATLVALVFSTFGEDSIKESIKKSMVYAAWMAGALVVAVLVFCVSTKAHSGFWPDFKHFSDYQTSFYIAGFNMLPMSVVHFWNLPMLVYLITGIYLVFTMRKPYAADWPVLVFLFILGCGLFAYFQGRSYDLGVDGVMYPAIIILGMLCARLQTGLIEPGKIRFHEKILVFLVPFLFIADGALSMLFYMPSIHAYSIKNAFSSDPEKDKALKRTMDFVNSNVPAKDTVLVFAGDYEAYFYASGNYYNPTNIQESTELYFKTDLYALVDFIKTTKYPIIYDGNHPFYDTVIKTLSRYTDIKKESPDGSVALMMHRNNPQPPRLATDANTVYYNGFGEFRKFILPQFNPYPKLNLPENFTVELIATLDTNRLAKDNVLFSNSSASTPFCGILMMQNTSDLTQYIFTYGNGKVWCNGGLVKLSCTHENHIVMKVQKNIISIYNNGIPYNQANTNSTIINSDGGFFINANFAGTLPELKISNQ